jgi:DNA polymerase-3 subunit delta
VRPDELEREIERKTLRPTYLLVGPEHNLRRAALERLKGAVVDPGAAAFNFSRFDATEGGAQAAIAAARTFPMMAPRRMVVLDNVERLVERDAAEVIGYARAPQTRTVLVLTAAELDRRTTLVRVLADGGGVVEFAKLKGYELERWAEARFRVLGSRISTASLKRLVDLVGSELDVLESEIEKLVLFCAGETTIPDRAVDALVERSRQHGIFELTRALGRRDRASALRLVGSLMAGGEPPLVIVTMLARHFRQVLVAKELDAQGRSAGEIASAAQIPPFLRDEFIAQARATDRAAAEAAYLRLAEADRRFKSSSVDPRMFMERLIAAF